MQRIQAALVYQVWTLSKILNIIAENSSKIWKYAYLMWELTKGQSSKGTSKSIFDHI